LDDHVTHEDLAAFAERVVNLPVDDAADGRERVDHLRDRLENFIDENPAFDLVKMLHAGSVAKGTGLSTLNDMDVAVYVTRAKAPEGNERLVSWLVERLREAFAGVLDPSQITPGVHCATVEYKSGKLRKVDVVPILYEGDPQDRGYLVAQDTGEHMLTSVRLHLDFVRSRKKAHPRHFAQVIRFGKWWVRQQKLEDGAFRFKSFMVELMTSSLVDRDLITPGDYPEALQAFFAYIVKSGLHERIAFTDYYPLSAIATSAAPIQVFDPVNPENNVAYRYTELDRTRIVEAADRALSAIIEARFADTKERAVQQWRQVLGPSLRP